MKKRLPILCLFSMALPTLSFAGTACSEKIPTAETIQKAFQLAIKSREALDASGAEVAIIGRVGQDLSQYGLRFSHAGFIWRDHPQAKWIVSHELNDCGTANSALFDEGLANFFFDDMYAWEAVILVPSTALQASIAERLKNKPQLLNLHEPHYSMVAYPFATKYQNSNQWVLEVLADAKMQDKTSSRAQSQAWLANHQYQPTRLQIPALQRLGGRLFKANIAFDDHPNALRFSSKIDTVTVDSLFQFIQQIDPETTTQQLAL